MVDAGWQNSDGELGTGWFLDLRKKENAALRQSGLDFTAHTPPSQQLVDLCQFFDWLPSRVVLGAAAPTSNPVSRVLRGDCENTGHAKLNYQRSGSAASPVQTFFSSLLNRGL